MENNELNNLEQPEVLEDSKEINYESEDGLLDATRELAEQMRNGSGAQEINEPSVDSQVSEVTEDNKETKPDEEIDLSDWLDKFELPHEVTLKSKGLETKTKKLSELFTLANAGLDYTKKRQEEAPLRKIGEYANQQGLTMEDLQILSDAKRGDKNAVGNIAKRYGVDLYDVDADSNYNPSQESHYVERNEAEDIANEIMRQPELFNEVQRTLGAIPRNVAEEIVSRADLLNGFKEDVQNGIAQMIIPEVIKRQSIDSFNKVNGNKTFYEYYGEVVNEFSGSRQPTSQQQVAKPEPQVNANATDKMKAGVSSTKISTSSDGDIDIWSKNLSPDELVAQIKLQAQRLRGQ